MVASRWSLWAQIAGDEHTARVYDCLLAYGALTPTQIAEHLACPRSTLYPAFDWLRDKGLISSSVEGRSVRYLAAAPSRWRAIAEIRRVEADQVIADVDSHMSEWAASYHQGPRPRARTFEGQAGLMAIREEVTRLGGDVWEYFAVDARLRAQAKVHEQERIQQSSEIHRGRVLLALENESDAPPFFDRRPFEVRWIKLDQAPFMGSLTLVQDRAYFVSTHDGNFGLIVESPETVQLLRSLHATAWSQAKIWEPPVGWAI